MQADFSHARSQTLPTKLRSRILDELHSAHTGIVKMKALARSYVWWPNTDANIKTMARECLNCSRIRPNPPKTGNHPWEYAISPWQQVHVDYADLFQNIYLLILVDSYSKWLEVIPTKSMTSATTIKILRNIFARFGLLYTLVSDNGTCFKSEEFEKFLATNEIQHKVTAPYHPAMNGQAKRYVQTTKRALTSMELESGDLHLNLNKFLIRYKKSPNIATGISPAELIFGRTIRCRLGLVKHQVSTEQNEKSMAEGKKRKFFNKGTKVQYRNYGNKAKKWNYDTIVSRSRNLHYDISDDMGRIQRHLDQVLPYEGPVPHKPSFKLDDVTSGNSSTIVQTISPAYKESNTDVSSKPSGDASLKTSPQSGITEGRPAEKSPTGPRRSQRISKSVIRLNL